MTYEQIEKEFEEIGTYTNEYGYVHKIPNYEKILSFLKKTYEAGVEEGKTKVGHIGMGDNPHTKLEIRGNITST